MAEIFSMPAPKNRQDAAIGWPFKAVFAILCALNPDKPESMVLSRIKQWQRMGIPKGVNVGRGTRCVYSDDALMGVSMINELCRLGFPAATAKAILESHDYQKEAWGFQAIFFRPDSFSSSGIIVDTKRIEAAITGA